MKVYHRVELDEMRQEVAQGLPDDAHLLVSSRALKPGEDDSAVGACVLEYDVPEGSLTASEVFEGTAWRAFWVSGELLNRHAPPQVTQDLPS